MTIAPFWGSLKLEMPSPSSRLLGPNKGPVLGELAIDHPGAVEQCPIRIADIYPGFSAFIIQLENLGNFVRINPVKPTCVLGDVLTSAAPV